MRIGQFLEIFFNYNVQLKPKFLLLLIDPKLFSKIRLK